MKYYLKTTLLALLGLMATTATAIEDNRIIITIPSQVAVKNDTFVLSDIANIIYQQPQQRELAEILGAIDFGKSPLRYDARNLQGEAVLSAIESLGVPRDSIGYRIPTHITVTRQIVTLEVVKPVAEPEELVQTKKLPPLVVKGQAISVLYKSGPLTVRLNGVAMASADKSDILMVKNTKSNKIIKTRVINSEQAEVITE